MKAKSTQKHKKALLAISLARAIESITGSRRIGLAFILAAMTIGHGIAYASDAPIVTNVTMVQANNRLVTISYMLTGAPGIVTLDIETNAVVNGVATWTSIGGTNITHVTGDAFKLVQDSASEKRKIYWASDKSWPDHRIVSPDKIRAVVKAVSTNTPPDYMVCNLKDGTRFYYDTVEQLPGGIDSDDYRKHLFVMRKIHAKGKTFRMCTAKSQAGYVRDYDTPHLVGFTHDYYMGVFEVTQWQWKNAMSNINNVSASRYDPSYFKGDLLPVESFSPPDSSLWGGTLPGPTKTEDGEYIDNWSVGSGNCFIKQMRTLTGLGEKLHSPTEAQWEFACRAGTSTAYSDGTEYVNNEATMATTLSKIARYSYNAYTDNGDGTITTNGTARVGSYAPNPWGLYDMHGNVSEWCRDFRGFGALEIYSDATKVYVDPTGPVKDLDPQSKYTHFSFRGGGWMDAAKLCQSGYRGSSGNCWGSDLKRQKIGCRLCFTIFDE